MVRLRSVGLVRRTFIEMMCGPLSDSEANVLSELAGPTVKLDTSISGYLARHSESRREVDS